VSKRLGRHPRLSSRVPLSLGAVLVTPYKSIAELMYHGLQLNFSMYQSGFDFKFSLFKPSVKPLNPLNRLNAIFV
jgi:hypothetical protein